MNLAPSLRFHLARLDYSAAQQAAARAAYLAMGPEACPACGTRDGSCLCAALSPPRSPWEGFAELDLPDDADTIPPSGPLPDPDRAAEKAEDRAERPRFGEVGK